MAEFTEQESKVICDFISACTFMNHRSEKELHVHKRKIIVKRHDADEGNLYDVFAYKGHKRISNTTNITIAELEDIINLALKF